MSGWGSGEWGASPWGTGDDAGPGAAPVVTFVDPVSGQANVSRSKPLTFSVTDDVSAVFSTLRVTVSGVEYITGGVAVNGASLVATANDGNGFDVVLTLPNLFPNLSQQSITVLVRDSNDLETASSIFFTVGAGTRLLSVTNVSPGLLAVNFSRPMRIDSTFLFEGNWLITPITTGASAITVKEVVGSTLDPDGAFLRIEGGGSTYQLSVLPPVVDSDGLPLEDGFRTTQFDILFEDEPADIIRLFDSIYGPLGITQRRVTRRTVDQHTADRSLALALDEQFRLRFQQLDNTVARTGREGIRRT